MSSSNSAVLNRCQTCLEFPVQATSIETLTESSEMFVVLTFCNIEIVHGLLNVICIKCVKKLKNMIEFRRQCTGSQKYLKMLAKGGDFGNTKSQMSGIDQKEENLAGIIERNSNLLLLDPLKVECEDNFNEDHFLFEEKSDVELGTAHEDSNIEESTHSIFFQKDENQYVCRNCQCAPGPKSSNSRNARPCTKCGVLYDVNNYSRSKYTYKFSMCNEKSEMGDIKPEIDNENFEMVNVKVEIDEDKFEIDDKKPEIEDEQSEMDNKKPEMDNKTPEKSQLLCQTCGLLYRNVTALNRHLTTTHSSKGNYPCEYCEKVFRFWVCKDRHQKNIHLKQRQYKCEVCQRAFATNDALKNHRRLHTGEKPCVCKICSRAFTQRSALRAHLKSVHGLVNKKKIE